MNKRTIISFLLIYFIFGCAYVETVTPKKEFIVFLKDNQELSSKSVTIEKYLNNQKENLYHVSFEKVHGGKTYLFGLIEINNNDGEEVKRLKLMENSKVVRKYSIQDILAKKPIILDSLSIYYLID